MPARPLSISYQQSQSSTFVTSQIIIASRRNVGVQKTCLLPMAPMLQDSVTDSSNSFCQVASMTAFKAMT